MWPSLWSEEQGKKGPTRISEQRLSDCDCCVYIATLLSGHLWHTVSSTDCTWILQYSILLPAIFSILSTGGVLQKLTPLALICLQSIMHLIQLISHICLYLLIISSVSISIFPSSQKKSPSPLYTLSFSFPQNPGKGSVFTQCLCIFFNQLCLFQAGGCYLHIGR